MVLRQAAQRARSSPRRRACWLTASARSTGMRRSSAWAGTNQAVSRSVVNGHREAEARQPARSLTLASSPRCRPSADAVVVLAPAVRPAPRRSARCGADPACSGRRLLRRHVGGAHAVRPQRPARHRRRALSHTPPQLMPDQQFAGALRVRADRMDARHVVAAAEPFGALGPVPQRIDQLPAAPKSAERNSPPGSVPAQTVPCAGRQRPDLHQLPGRRRWRAFGLRRVGRRGHLVPADARIVGRMQLDAEVPEVQRRAACARRPAAAAPCSPARRGSCALDAPGRRPLRRSSNRPLRVATQARSRRLHAFSFLRTGPACTCTRLCGASGSASATRSRCAGRR